MRWIWIDRIIELEHGQRCAAIKNVSLGEDVVHDHFPATDGCRAAPMMPHTLVIEGMAQTAGILVGHAQDFRQKVILAKIGRAHFQDVAKAGYCLRFDAKLERIDEHGASTTGTVTRLDPASGERAPLAQINLTFSHVDQNRSGIEFPEHNFVFTEQFMDLLRDSGFGGVRH